MGKARYRLLLVACCVLVGYMMPAAAANGVGSDEELIITEMVSVSPAREELEVAPGRSASVELSIGNGTDDPLRVELTPSALCASDTPDVLARPCSENAQRTGLSWVRIPDPIVIVEPHTVARTMVTVAPPPTAIAGAYAVAIESSLPGVRPKGTGVRVESTAVTQLLLTVSGKAEADLHLDTMRPPRFVPSGESVDFAAVATNTGNTFMSATGELEIDAFLATADQQLDAELPPTLPGAQRTVVVRWNETPFFGTFTPELRLTAENGEVYAADFPRLWVLPPWWFWVALAVALSVPLAARSRRR